MPSAEAQKGRALLGSGLVSLVIKVAGAALSYAMIVAFARLLPPDEYGRYGLGLNLAIIAAAFGGFGMSTGIMRYWPKYLAQDNAPAARAVVALGYRLILLGGVAVSLIGLVGAAIAHALGHAITVADMAAIATLGLAINFGDYATNLLRAQGSTVVSMLPRDVLWRVLSPLLMVAALYAGAAATSRVALLLTAAALVALVIWQGIHVRRAMVLQASGNGGTFDRRDILPSLMPLWASGIIFAMIQQFDVVIVGTLIGPAEAGGYFAAQKTAMLLSLVLIAGGLATAPTMAALYHSGKNHALQALCRKLALAIAVVTLIGFVMLLVIGKYLLAFFDPSFVSAYPVLVVVAVGCMVDAMAGPNAYLMQMTSYERHYLWIMLACYLLVLVGQIILIPLFGVLGAALASAGGVICWNVAAIAILRRKAGLDPSLLSLLLPPAPKTGP
ncbi:MAG: polysaccharide biosynthesis C-terminal domain-containing protein [Hyphomicrobiales bacterium]